MTSVWSRVAVTAAIAAGLAQVGASATSVPSNPIRDLAAGGKVPATQAAARPAAVQIAAATAVAAAQPVARPAAPQAPSYIRDRINALGRDFNGRVGIAVQSVEDGWVAGWKAGELYPQQSASKLWVAITALDAADKGKVNLAKSVTLGRSDLTLFHQPIRARVLNGGHSTTLDALLVEALTKSDNTANDKLMRSVGGAEAVRAMIRSKKLGDIRFDNGERALQSKIAGLTWNQSYSIGNAFYEARKAVPMAKRKAAFDRYVADPYDGASAEAVVAALARLKKGDLLSPESTAKLLRIMSNTRTGPNRLKGGLAPGWTLAHKTGTGQVLSGIQAGYNDIGIVTAPDGRSYAVAVLIKRTGTPLSTRMTLMNNVVRAIIAQHERGRGIASL